MRHYAFLSWLTIATGLLAAGHGVQADRLPIPGIHGRDDRALVDTTAYPWGAIGRINNTLGGFCTGTLIGPRWVLTAAHCLWNGRTGSWVPACALHFLAGYQRGQYLAHALVAGYHLAGQHDHQRPPGPPAPEQDWAVLILAADLAPVADVLPTAPLDPALLADYRQAGVQFVRAGYSRDHPHLLTRHDACELQGFTHRERLLVHACDATFGDSGSPILARIDDQYVIVALHIALEQGQDVGLAVTGAAFHETIRGLETPDPPTAPIKACRGAMGGITIAYRPE